MIFFFCWHIHLIANKSRRNNWIFNTIFAHTVHILVSFYGNVSTDLWHVADWVFGLHVVIKKKKSSEIKSFSRKGNAKTIKFYGQFKWLCWLFDGWVQGSFGWRIICRPFRLKYIFTFIEYQEERKFHMWISKDRLS